MKGLEKLKKLFLPCHLNNYCPEILNKKFLYAFVFAFFIFKFVFFLPILFLPKSYLFTDLSRYALVDLVNKTRQERGVSILSLNSTLNKVAYLKAKDILEKDYFSHTNPEGKSFTYWFDKIGYKYQYAGENLAIGFLDSQEVFDAWLNSASHRENILNPKYKETGIAILKGDFQGRNVWVIVQVFGTQRLEKTSKKISSLKEKTEKSVFSEKEVLSAKTQEINLPLVFSSDVSLDNFEKNKKEYLTFNLLGFLFFNFFDLTKGLAYALSILILVFVFITVFYNFFVVRPPKEFWRNIFLKTSLFLIVLFFVSLIDKIHLLKFLPHQIVIF